GDPAITGKSSGNDIRKGKSTVIVCHALENIKDESEMKMFRSILGKLDASESEIDLVRDILKRTGSIDYAVKMAERYTNDAISKLDCLEQSDEKDFMIALARYAMSREL
ncbi:MAG: polyprenyl synthetase family protein, partial [Candidatus Methanomethylophilaceae archaeon]